MHRTLNQLIGRHQKYMFLMRQNDTNLFVPGLGLNTKTVIMSFFVVNLATFRFDFLSLFFFQIKVHFPSFRGVDTK